MRVRMRRIVVLAVLALAAAACTGGKENKAGQGQAAGGASATGSYPRNQTLYTGGTQWGPPSN
jgi:peptide/nickel transport system substrate-binding protein